MNTLNGYSKSTLTDQYILTAAGGHLAVDNLLTDLSSDSTNKISITVGNNTKTISTLYASYLLSLGVLAPQTGRNLKYGDVYTYNTNTSVSGGPITHSSVLGFGRGARGAIEICGEWTSGRSLWVRALRDVTDNWYAWDRILTEATYKTVLDKVYCTETKVNDKLLDYVTLTTEQIITGSKTFTAATNTFSGTGASILTVDRNSSSPTWIKFMNDGTLLGYLGITNDNIAQFHNGTYSYILLHSGNYSSYLPFLNSSSTHATKTSVIYAPSTAGTKGCILTSNGSGAPVWSSITSLKNPYSIKFKKTDGTSVSYDGSSELDLTSGLDADSLNGKHLKSIMYVGDSNAWDTQSGNRIILFNTTNTPLSSSAKYGSILQWTAFEDSTPGIGNNSWYYLLWGCTSFTRLHFRMRTNSGDWSTLKQLAFIDDIPTKVSQLLNDSGYLTSRGFIGTTTVLASSKIQALTGISSIFVNTGDATLKVYNGGTSESNDGTICLLTSIDGTDGLSHTYPTLWHKRCNLALLPRGGSVYIGTVPEQGTSTYKLWVEGSSMHTGAISSDLNTRTHLNGNKGTAIINSTAAAGYNMLAKMNSTNGVFTIGAYDNEFNLYYTTNTTIAAETNSTTYRAQLLNESGNTVFPGILYVGSLLNVNNNYFNYGLAILDSRTATVTGTIVITLPVSFTNSMNTYEIDIYEYNGYDSTLDNTLYSKLIISGYNWDGEDGKWINYGYVQLGSYAKGVRLGYNGSKCCILLGNTSSTWKYPKIRLSRVLTAHENTSKFNTGYSISTITSESGYSRIVSAYRLKLRFERVVATEFTGSLAKTLTFAAGTFAAKTYNNSADVTVNIPTKTSHLTNDSNFFTVTAISNNTNVNTLKDTTLYYINTDGNASTLTNAPYTKGFAMLLLKCYEDGGDLRRCRLAIDGYGAARLFNDRDTSDTGGTWVDILTSKNSEISGNGGNTWGSSVTIKINGITKTLTIPTNPNTDYLVKQSSTTTSNFKAVLLGTSNNADNTALDNSDTTGQAYLTEKLYYLPSSGTLFTTRVTADTYVSNTYSVLGYCGAAGDWSGGTASSLIVGSNISTIIRSSGDDLYHYNWSANGRYKILDSYNSSVTGGGSSWGSKITVKINGETKTLTIPSNPNTWRGITDSYSGTATDTSLSLKGANDLYNALVNGYASSAGSASSATKSYYLTGDSISNLCNPQTWSDDGARLVYNIYSDSATNKPISVDNANGIITLFKTRHGTSGLFVTLIAAPDDGNLYVRYSLGGTWKSWKTIAFTGHTHSKFTVFGVEYNGSAAKTVTGETLVETLSEGTSNLTDGTMLLTSYASDNGFADTNAPNKIYKRKASCVWEYIKGKTDERYLKTTGGTINSTSTSLYLNRTAAGTNPHITFLTNGTAVGDIGVSHDKKPIFYDYEASTWVRLVTQSFNGNITATAFYASSDINLKTNIHDLTSSDNIPLLKEFDWKEDGSHSYGLIAQELEEMGYSELVTESENHKTVNYSAALSLIVGKLQVKIKELETEIENLKNKN